MTYSAPRHGLFAIIILISLTLNLLFFVISSERQLGERYETSAQKEALLIAEELSAPLSINDRISMSVIANRYIKTDDLAFIGIYDVNDNLLVPVGKESLGFQIKEMVTGRDSVLGYVVVHTHEINRANIISNHWIYLVAVAFLHFALWLLYGYMARPTDKIRIEIAHDVRNRLLAKGLLYEASHKHSEHQNSDSMSSVTNNSADTPSVRDTHKHSHDVTDQTHGTNKHHAHHEYAIQICFDDPHDLLATVGKQTKTAYFSLCHQLVSRAINELLILPPFHEVRLKQMSAFTDKGCQIMLTGGDKYSKSALASVMLARLVLMLNQTIYDKHRELKRFALPVRTYVSDPARQSEVVSVGTKHRKTPLVLLPPKVIASLSSQGNFMKLADPVSVAERECRHLRHLSLSHAETLERVRDKVLLSN